MQSLWIISLLSTCELASLQRTCQPLRHIVFGDECACCSPTYCPWHSQTILLCMQTYSLPLPAAGHVISGWDKSVVLHILHSWRSLSVTCQVCSAHGFHPARIVAACVLASTASYTRSASHKLSKGILMVSAVVAPVWGWGCGGVSGEECVRGSSPRGVCVLGGRHGWGVRVA